jgi:putative transposase
VTEEKVEIVKRHAPEYGLNVTLRAIGLPKSTWYYWKNERRSIEERYSFLKEPLMNVLRDHPGYGYRRIEPELQERGVMVGERRVRRALRMWDLSLRRAATPAKPSVPRRVLHERGMNLIQGLQEVGPLAVFVTDFAELRYAGGRKRAYFMPILDHRTKWVAGWSVGQHRDTELAKAALTMTERELSEVGLDLEGRILHHDQDPVYTGYGWLYRVLVKAQARVSYSENGAKGNTVMESFFGRFKTENRSLLLDARNIWELRRTVGEQVDYYNRERRHSALGYLTPMDYLIQEEILPAPAVDLATLST